MNKLFFLIATAMVTMTGVCGTSIDSRDSRIGVSQTNTREGTTGIQSDVYGVIIDALQKEFGSDQILILNRTTFGRVSPDNSEEKVVMFLEKRLDPKVRKELIESFRVSNREPGLLPSSFDTKVPYSFFEAGQLQSGDGAVSPVGSFSDGSLVTFSQIGFTPDKRNALVYISSQNGTRSGWGYYVVLEFVNDLWRVNQKLPAWNL